MFYTKYRPQKFSDISRPNEAADALSKEVKSGKTVHAYLFVGSRGTGKTSTARILAKALNCENIRENGDPCDKCDNCTAIKNGSFIDMVEIDAASNRGIDDIRLLQDRVKLAPSRGKNKVYIIDEVHMLTLPAFNALLKTLEEPPKNTTFILCTTELHKVPDTIKSRCQVFKFKRATISQIVSKLEFIAKQEGAKIDKTHLSKIATASWGGFRDAETLLQQVIEGEISSESLVGSASRELSTDLTDYLIEKDVSACLKLVNKLGEDGIDIYTWMGDYLIYLRDLLFLKSGVLADMGLPEEMLHRITQQASVIALEDLTLILSLLLDAHKKVKSSFLAELPLEIALVEFCGHGFVTNADNKNIPPDKNPDKNLSKNLGKSLNKSLSGIESSEGVIASSSVEETKKENMTNDESTVSVSISLDKVKEVWPDFLTRIEAVNNPLFAMLKSARLLGIQDKNISLEVYYAFHKERIESTKNRKIIEDISKDLFSTAIGIKCVINSQKPEKLKSREVGVLTDVNVVPVSPDSVMEFFDGGLPL